MSDKFKVELGPKYADLLKLANQEAIKVAEISAADIKTMNDGDIIAILTGEKTMGGIIPLATQKVLTNELLTRTIKTASKPHWSVIPSFWLLVTTVVLTALALLMAFVGLK